MVRRWYGDGMEEMPEMWIIGGIHAYWYVCRDVSITFKVLPNATLMPINSQLPLKTLCEKATGMPMLNKTGREGVRKG